MHRRFRALVAFVEKYVFKVRDIIVYQNVPELEPAAVLVVPMVSYDHCSMPDGLRDDARLFALLERRRGSEAWVGFFLIAHKVCKGYSFLHVPTEIEWMDCLPTGPDEARESSTFVYPKFRGMGVRAALLSAQQAYAHIQKRTMWAIIERANDASRRSALKAGGRCARRNYLIKIAARNVMSILSDPTEMFVLVGQRRARR